MKPLKPKKCRCCKKLFEPRNSLQVVCSPLCAIQYEETKKAKKAAKVVKSQQQDHRADLKQFRDNDKALQLRKAQEAFNKFIRLRDKDEPCISCGRFHTGQYHASHLRSIGSTKGIALDGILLRFHEDNVWRCCSVCNNHKSGNLLEFRAALVKKIGAERVEAIENAHEFVKLSLEDIHAIKATYKNKIKQLENKTCIPDLDDYTRI